MNHIFYQTKTKFSNSGDALINNALINTLRNYGKIYANCSNDIPDDFISELGIFPEEKYISNNEKDFIISILKCAKKAKKANEKVYLFSGPGDSYGGGLKSILRNFASAVIFFLFRIYGVKIVRIGRSMGPVSRMMAISEYIKCLFVSHYYVRDTQSLMRCHKIGIKKTKLCPDMSWLYLKDLKRTINNSNVIMLNLRNSIFDNIEEAFINQTLDQCEKILKVFHNEMGDNMIVRIAYQTYEDKEFSEIIFNRLKDKYTVEYIDHQLKLNEMDQYYGDVAYHISNRMHSILLGYKFGSLPIAVIDTKKHVKIAATMADCGLDYLMVDIKTLDSEIFVKDIIFNRKKYYDNILNCEKTKQYEILTVLDEILMDHS